MKRAAAALLFFVLFPPSLPAQNQKQILLGLASISGGIDLLYVTKKIGAFKRNGLDVDFILFQGGSQALQVLLAGDVKMISGGGGTAAQRARMKGAGNLLVATYTTTMPFSLYVNNKIQDVKQLKGSKIAISRFGSSSDFAARYISDPARGGAGEGSDPDADRQPARALRRFAKRRRGRRAHRSAQHAARPSEGFRQLADTSALGLAYPHNNIATTDRFIREEPETVMAFCALLPRASLFTRRTNRRASR
jgi:ABC-type nitrate/sulfonate/bicarbonate transport system substrate-binding protein